MPPETTTPTTQDAPIPPQGYAEQDALIDSIPSEHPEPVQPVPEEKKEAPQETKVEAAPEAKAAPVEKKPSDQFGVDERLLGKAPVKPEQTEEPKSLKEFRSVYEQTKSERDALRAEIAKLTEAQKQAAKQNLDEYSKPLKDEIDRYKAEVAKLDTELRYLNYTRSAEYKEKYEAPLADAWKRAMTDIDGLQIDTGNGVRAASGEDILALIRLPAGPASIKAKELFGDAAPEVLAHRRQLLSLSEARDKAVEEWRTKGDERSKEQERVRTERMSKLIGIFDQTISDAASSMPELFGEDPADKEGSELMMKGDDLVSLAFRGKGATGLPDSERDELIAKAQAHVAIRAKVWARERMRVVNAQKRISELEAKLKGYEKSEPAAAATPAEPKSGAEESPESLIDRIPSYRV